MRDHRRAAEASQRGAGDAAIVTPFARQTATEADQLRRGQR
jgi:hypothetical protein